MSLLKIKLILLLLAISFSLSAQQIPDGFVYLKEEIPSLLINLRYASSENFTGKIVPGYNSSKAIGTKELATALKKVTKSNLLTGFTNSFVKFTGNGSTTAYTILSGRTVSDVLVFVDGSHMTPSDDYTISGTTLTFGSAPANSKVIIIRYLQI